MIVHVVKKRTEETNVESELAVFKKWIIDRPFNTFAAAIAAIGIALGLQVTDATPLIQFLQGLTAGFTANSAVNRTEE
jgi:hypothetical protein